VLDGEVLAGVSDDAEVVLDPESAEGAAAATAVPRLSAPKPREPAMAAEAAIFLMVLSEVMSFPSYVLAGLSGRDKRIERSPQWILNADIPDAGRVFGPVPLSRGGAEHRSVCAVRLTSSALRLMASD
jgi:hypothetical protein